MKEKTLIITGLCLFLMMPLSQAGIRWGAKAGVNLSEASFSWDALNPDNFTGFQVGPIAEFKLPIVGLGMDAAVLYSLQGFKVDGQTEKHGSLDLPLNIKYKFGLLGVVGAYGSAGAYASFKVSGDDFSLADIPDQFKYKTFGAGLNFGFGFELFNHLQLGANYQLGLTDDYSSKDYSIKSKTWSVTAAYFF